MPLQKDVFRFRERQRLLDEVAKLKRKRPWMEFEAAREAIQVLKDQLTEAEKRQRELRARTEPFQKSINEAKAASEVRKWFDHTHAHDVMMYVCGYRNRVQQQQACARKRPSKQRSTSSSVGKPNSDSWPPTLCS
jgi:hypothetical protein